MEIVEKKGTSCRRLLPNRVVRKKVALSSIGKRRMKKVDKDIDENNKQ